MNEIDITSLNIDQLAWRKSSYSPNTNCVELAEVPDSDLVAMRNSNDPSRGILWLRRGQVSALVRGAKDGELDDLI